MMLKGYGVKPTIARSLRWYIVSVCLLAVGAALVVFLSWPEGTLSPIMSFQSLAFCALVVLATVQPVLLAPDSKVGFKVNVATTPIFASLFLLGTPTTVAIAFTGVLIANTWLRRPWYNVLFNLAQTTIYVSCTGFLISLFLRVDQPFQFTGWMTSIVVVLAAVCSYVVNTALVAGATALQIGRSPWELWYSQRRLDIVQETALFLFGFLTILTVGSYPWSIVLLVVPVVVVHWSFSSNLQVRQQTREAIEELAEVVELRDVYTRDHSQRVSDYSVKIATRLRLPHDQIDVIRLAARVHDIGKINLSNEILRKPTRLDGEEWAQMQLHPEMGARIISKFPDYRSGRDIVLCHHERLDGTGYPHRLQGEAIPLGARIVAVADTFDAMTSSRSYRSALPITMALNELQRHAGTQHDARVVDAMVSIVREELRDSESRQHRGATAGRQPAVAG